MTTKATDIKVGDLMSITYYFKVTGKKDNAISCVDATNSKMSFDITGNELIETCTSADQFTTESRVTMTTAAERLISTHGEPFTVCFTKQEGGDRVLRGRLIAPETVLGRSKVEDLDLPPTENRMRLVDHRTIKWLVVGGKKYVVR